MEKDARASADQIWMKSLAIIQYSHVTPRKTPSGILAIAIGPIDTRRMNLSRVPLNSPHRIGFVNHRSVAFRRRISRIRLNLLHYSIIAATTFTSALFSTLFLSLFFSSFFVSSFIVRCRFILCATRS